MFDAKKGLHSQSVRHVLFVSCLSQALKVSISFASIWPPVLCKSRSATLFEWYSLVNSAEMSGVVLRDGGSEDLWWFGSRDVLVWWNLNNGAGLYQPSWRYLSGHLLIYASTLLSSQFPKPIVKHPVKLSSIRLFPYLYLTWLLLVDMSGLMINLISAH